MAIKILVGDRIDFFFKLIHGEPGYIFMFDVYFEVVGFIF